MSPSTSMTVAGCSRTFFDPIPDRSFSPTHAANADSQGRREFSRPHQFVDAAASQTAAPLNFVAAEQGGNFCHGDTLPVHFWEHPTPWARG